MLKTGGYYNPLPGNGYLSAGSTHMATKQQAREQTAAAPGTSIDDVREQAELDTAEALAAENAASVDAAMQAALGPRVGETVFYRVRAGVEIPMVVTHVHEGGMVSGVAFSARHQDVGSASGTMPVSNVPHGPNDGQWHRVGEA